MASTVLARKLRRTIIGEPRRRGCAVPYAGARSEFHRCAGPRSAGFLAYRASPFGDTFGGGVWRLVAVTVHVPSLQSAAPLDGTPLRVRTVEVSVLPDVSLLP